MLQPQIDNMVRNKKQNEHGVLGLADGEAAKQMPNSTHKSLTTVNRPAISSELDVLLKQSEHSCAVIFFTSETCGPCKPLYPVFQELADEAGNKATFIVVDIGRAYDAAQKYSITATPTFLTFLNGQEENRWFGGSAYVLRGNVATLIQMAWPPHPHESLRLPILRGADRKPVLYSKVPPLSKLLSKIGDKAQDPALQGVKHFITAHAEGAAEATLPDMNAFSRFLRDNIPLLPPEVIFAVIDLLRVAMSDPRFSGYYAEETDHKTIAPIFEYVNKIQDCPYSLRLVALQTACNLFSSPLYIAHTLGCEKLRSPLIDLAVTSLLDDKHDNTRVAAASLIFNIASANSNLRTEERREALPEGDQVELAVALLEAIGIEGESGEALKGYLLALGYLIFCSPKDGELADMLRSMDAQGTILTKSKIFPKEGLVTEIGKVLMGS